MGQLPVGRSYLPGARSIAQGPRTYRLPALRTDLHPGRPIPRQPQRRRTERPRPAFCYRPAVTAALRAVTPMRPTLVAGELGADAIARGTMLAREAVLTERGAASG
jgi:hypothetical protein